MIIISSISPNHSNFSSQQLAINSWQLYSDQIFSMNCADEIKELQKENYEGIEFLETSKTVEYYCNKPLVSINAMIDIAKIHGKDLLLVNSDIELSELPMLRQNGITIFSRYDYAEDKATVTLFKNGFDVFFIPKQFLNIFPPSIYGMGNSHWDFFLPYTAIKIGVPVYYPKGIHAYHKTHKQHYDYSEWLHLGEFFKWQFKMAKQLSVPQITTATLAIIKSRLISI